jgi:AcrR family transcriptional regulator
VKYRSTVMTRQNQAEATREAVLDSARRLWAAKGFFTTSTAEIVEHAGVGTRGAFYHHFKDREELFVAVFVDVQARLATELLALTSTEADPLSRLAAQLSAFLEITSRSQDVQALLIDGPAVFGLKRWQELEEQRGLASIEAQLLAAEERGIIAHQPVRPLAQMLLILVNGAALSVAGHQDPKRARVEAGAALVTLVEGLRRVPRRGR